MVPNHPRYQLRHTPIFSFMLLSRAGFYTARDKNIECILDLKL